VVIFIWQFHKGEKKMKQTLIVPALSSDTVSLRKGKKNLNRLFVVLALSVAFILVAWGIIKPFTSSLLATTSNTAAIPAQFIAGEMSGGIRSGGMAVPVAGANFKVAPVFDATGALVSNPTGMLLNLLPLGSLAVPIPAQYIAEEMSGGVRSGGTAVPVTGANFKVAPVFDATGTIVSDPTGTLLRGIEE
jgi:hypothetical protein